MLIYANSGLSATLELHLKRDPASSSCSAGGWGGWGQGVNSSSSSCMDRIHRTENLSLLFILLHLPSPSPSLPHPLLARPAHLTLSVGGGGGGGWPGVHVCFQSGRADGPLCRKVMKEVESEVRPGPGIHVKEHHCCSDHKGQQCHQQ